MSKPNVPIVNAAYLNIQGLNLAWVDNTHITVSAGQARNNSTTTNTNDINVTALVTVNGGTNGLNGLDTGALANTTLYAVYAIGDSSQNNPAGAILSTSFAGPLLPMGYDMFRRIGAVRTDGAAHILAFAQTGTSTSRTMWYDAPFAVLAAAASAVFVALDCSAVVPAESTAITFRATLIPNVAGEFVAIRPTGSASAVGYVKMSGDVAAVSHIDSITCPCSTAASVDWITDAASTVALAVANYVDNI